MEKGKGALEKIKVLGESYKYLGEGIDPEQGCYGYSWIVSRYSGKRYRYLGKRKVKVLVENYMYSEKGKCRQGKL